MKNLNEKFKLADLRKYTLVIDLDTLIDIQGDYLGAYDNILDALSIRLSSLKMEHFGDDGNILLGTFGSLHESHHSSALIQLIKHLNMIPVDKISDGEILQDYLDIFLERVNSTDAKRYLLKLLRKNSDRLESEILTEK